MADRPMITFPAAILESDDLLVLALFNDLTRDGCSFDERIAVRKLVAVAMKKHVSENTFFADFFIKKIHINDVALGNAMLSATCFDNCVSHGCRKSRAKSHVRQLLTRGNLRRFRGLGKIAAVSVLPR
jgi:hypothetical protein